MMKDVSISNKFVSIILPTYNVERYLSQCIDSILHQTYQNFEVIIVIDGATDRSLEIAQEYALKDNRLKIVYQENSGSGPARNNGLRHANGELIMFVDPDDWLDNTHVANLVNEQIRGNYDLVASFRKLIYFNSIGSIVKCEPQKIMDILINDANAIHPKYFEFGSFIKSPTNKLYKKSLILENGISFPDLRRSQDIVFNYRYFEKIKSLRVIPIADYNYRIQYTERMLRLKADYHLTTILMFNDLRCMFERLHLEFPIVKACNYFFDDIIAIIESYITNRYKINNVMNDSTIKYIIRNSKPKGILKKIQKQILMRCNKYIIYYFFKLKNIIKIRLNS